MKKTIVCCLLLGFAASTLKAQINESDTIKLQLRASFTGSYQQGNVALMALRGRADGSYWFAKNWVFKSQNSSLYQSFYAKKADNDVFSRNYLYLKPYHRVYPFAIGYVSSNFRRKITLRYFAGVGASVQLLKKAKHVVKLSANAVYESTKFGDIVYNDARYNGDNRINLWRSTLYVGGWSYLMDRRIRMYYDAFGQIAWRNRHNYRTQADLGFDCPIWKGLSLNALFTYTHEQVVVQKIKPDDQLVTFGLSYTKRLKRKQ